MGILFNGSLFYGWTKMRSLPTSISALWVSDVHLIYRFTVIGVSLLSILHLNAPMVLAGLSIIGILIFPNIENKKEKMIHDIFAILFFAFMSYNVHWVLIPILVALFVALSDRLSLYWLEILGFNILITTTLIL